MVLVHAEKQSTVKGKMRCPDCNKFVSMETQEPEINTLEVENCDGEITVTIDGRTLRNCADCGTELKAVDWCDSDSLNLSEFDGWDKLSPEQQNSIKTECSPEVEENCCSIEESGGGRYKKNIISTIVGYEITVPVQNHPDVSALKFEGCFRFDNAASEFEEQV